MKKLFRYLFSSVIDFILLCLFIILLIKSLIDGWWNISPYIIGGITFAIIYILGIMWRIGGAYDLMSEYITDDSIRLKIGLNIYSLRNQPIKQSSLAIIFKWVFIVSAIVVMLLGIL
jgi:hypothetical protein